MSRTLFIDTGFVLARSVSTDALHDKATALWRDALQSGTRFVTTDAVLIEIGNAMSKPRTRTLAVKLLAALTATPEIEVASLTPELYTKAFTLYRERHDKSWGLTDCISFVVM